MHFPPLDELPQLTAQETVDWSYPIYEGRPYTKLFANHLIDLIALEGNFWRYLKYIKQQGEFADIYLDVCSHGHRSLPDWSFKVQERSFQPNNSACTLLVRVDQAAYIHPSVNSNESALLEGDWSNRNSDLGALIRHLLPYISKISIATQNDSVDLNPPNLL